MRTVSYKGYQASVEYEDGSLFVKVLHIDDVLIGECDAASEAPRVLQDLVEGYLQDCAELGRQPTKPFKGSFNVRMTPEMHRLIAMDAASRGMSLNAWISEAATEKLECERWGTRIDGVVFQSQEKLQRWVSSQVMRLSNYHWQASLHLSSGKRSALDEKTQHDRPALSMMRAFKAQRTHYHG